MPPHKLCEASELGQEVLAAGQVTVIGVPKCQTDQEIVPPVQCLSKCLVRASLEAQIEQPRYQAAFPQQIGRVIQSDGCHRGPQPIGIDEEDFSTHWPCVKLLP